MKFSIVIPAMNEEKRIGKTLQEIGDFVLTLRRKPVDGLTEKNFEVIVVVNNSTDGTLNVVKKFQQSYPAIVPLNIPYYTGKGGAVIIGFQKARGKFIALMDSDGSAKFTELLKVYRTIAEHPETDIAIASRYIKGGKILMQPLSRTLFSRAFNLAIRILFGIQYSDTQCGYKVFRKPAAKDLLAQVTAKRWTFDLNILLLAKYLGYTVKEVPVTWSFTPGSTLNTTSAFIMVSKELISLKAVDLQLMLNSLTGKLYRAKAGPQVLEK